MWWENFGQIKSESMRYQRLKPTEVSLQMVLVL